MQTFAVQKQGVPGAHCVFAVGVSVDHHPFQHVEQLSARMLKQRKRLALVGQRDQDRFEPLVLTAQCPEEFIVMPDAGAAAHDHRTFGRLGEHCLAAGVCTPQQGRDRHV